MTRSLTVLIALALTLCAFPTSWSAADRPLIFGINPTWGEWVNLPPDTYDPAMFDKMAEARCAVTRSGFDWCNMEPSPGVYVWEPYESRVNWAVERGIEWVGLICTTPGWANETGQNDIYRPLESAAPYFEAWCTELARHYKGRVKYYEFWNEMDCCGGWKPVSNAEEYTRWLKRCYTALKAGDPDCMVSVGGYLGRDMGFLHSIYNHGGRGYFDAVAAHPYGGSGQGLPYFDQVHLENIRAVMVSRGDAHKPIWVTEYGWWVSPDQEANQAQWLQATLDLISQPQYDYVTIMTYHTISDFTPAATAGMGLCRVDLSPKQAFNVFKNYPRMTSPVISDVHAADVTFDAATIRWATDVPATSQVDYGIGAYQRSTPLDPTLVTEHSVRLTGLSEGTRYQYRVRSSAAPHGENVSQMYYVTTASRVPNYLRNPDMEEGFIYSDPDPPYTRAQAREWSFYGLDWWRDGADLGLVHSGSHSQAVSTNWLLLHESMYQQVGVTSGEYYEFSVWTRAETTGSAPPHLDRKVGIDALGATDPDAASIVWSHASQTEGVWERQKVIAQARSDVITVHARCDSFKATDWTHVVMDDAALRHIPVCASVSEARSMHDGVPVRLIGLRVSAVFADGFYAQSADRAEGIRIIGGPTPFEGAVVDLIGELSTANGERVIADAVVSVH